MDDAIKEVNLWLDKRKELRFCITCLKSVLANTYFLRERETSGIVSYYEEGKPFICEDCVKKENKDGKNKQD